MERGAAEPSRQAGGSGSAAAAGAPRKIECIREPSDRGLMDEGAGRRGREEEVQRTWPFKMPDTWQDDMLETLGQISIRRDYHEKTNMTVLTAHIATNSRRHGMGCMNAPRALSRYTRQQRETTVCAVT